MLLKAAEDFNIDLSQSWMIGDSENDIRTGKTAGRKTALIGEVILDKILLLTILVKLFLICYKGGKPANNSIIRLK